MGFIFLPNLSIKTFEILLLFEAKTAFPLSQMAIMKQNLECHGVLDLEEPFTMPILRYPGFYSSLFLCLHYHYGISRSSNKLSQ